MKRFKFRYQTLLDERERREKAEEDKLREALAALASAEALAAELAAQFDAARAEQRAQSEGALDLQALLLFQEYMMALERRMDIQREVVTEAEARVEARRGLLAEARQAAEIVRKLKQKAEKAWLAELDAAEAAFLDELATMRHARAERESGDSRPAP